MLRIADNDTIATSGIESSLQELRKIISQRLLAYSNQMSFNIQDWLQQQYGYVIVEPHIKEIVPQINTVEEWVVLMMALAPHLQPEFFQSIIQEHFPQGGDFVEFGGVRGTNHRGILPTGETIQFIIAGNDMKKRMEVQSLFETTHFFYQNDILTLEQVKEGEPAMSGRVILAPEWINYLLTGCEVKPKYGADFPAKLTTTKMTWDDLVLHPYTSDQIEDIKRWLQYRHLVEADPNLSRKINVGYRVLFYGASGTGKTLTATLLGKEFGKDVYRIDLSQIVSKFIGETEKNLNKIFDRAEHKNWILFFDEADSLFGKRTSVQSSHDKYANQEVSFLLQRIEEFNGLMILASNFKSNIDEAFLRRFHSVINFPMPNAQERQKLWSKALPQSIGLDETVNLKELAESYEISGASIINIVQFAALKALSQPGEVKLITQEGLIDGIRRELRKEEKSF